MFSKEADYALNIQKTERGKGAEKPGKGSVNPDAARHLEE